MRVERLLLVLALLPACGDKSDPCDAPASATFETVPNGPLGDQLVIGGIRLSQLGIGTVTVLRDGTTMPPTPAVFLANDGRLVAFADCDAHAVDLAFDATDAPLVIELLGGDTGGGGDSDGGGSPPSYRIEASAITTTADTVSGYRRATLAMPDGGKIRRVELRGTGGNTMGTAGALVRLIGFQP